jgi:hypothetical protein
VLRATAKPVCDALAEAMRTHGIPEAILTDNGKVFTGRFGRGPGPVLFDRVCQDNGIRHLLTAPHSPTTTGKVERFHKTLKKDFLKGKVFETIEEAQAAIDGWVREYNHERPHQSVGDRAPIERFRLAKPELFESVDVAVGEPAAAKPTAATAVSSTRRVGANGRVSLARTTITSAGGWRPRPSRSSAARASSRSSTPACSSPLTLDVTHRRRSRPSDGR